MTTQQTENKVEYGLQDVHWAKITGEDSSGNLTYETPKPLPGAVDLELEPKGEAINFQADNTTYHAGSSNQGYTGTLTIAKPTQDFLIEILGQKLASDGTLSEFSDSRLSEFALMFQIEGDKNAVRHLLYRCSVSRPKESSKTKEGDVNTTELSFTATERKSDKKVKTKTTATTTQEVYDNWYKKVYEPELGVTMD